MHRSGTSLLGSLLQALGVELPGQLIGADQHNPEGYFEWQELVALQERLLIDLDRWWPSANGCLALPEGWLQHPATAAVREQLLALLRPQRHRHSAPWAIKDPRTSRLLPLWLDAAAELEIPLRLLLAVRDPAEVARSLMRRDGPITGMDLARAQQLWWRHTLEPLQVAPADLPLAVVDFGAWFSQPEVQLERLLAALPELRPSPEQRRRALALIRPEHRRSLAASQPLVLHRRVHHLHRALLTPGQRRWPAADPPGALARPGAVPTPPLPLATDPGAWPAWLESRRHHPAPRHPGAATLAPQALISLCGLPLTSWQAHLWLQQLPIPQLAAAQLPQPTDDPHNFPLALSAVSAGAGGLERIAINLELPPPERAPHWLNHLHQQQAIWDPDAPRVGLLRALGLPAYWLDPAAPPNGWLQQPAAASAACWAAELGLAPPIAASVAAAVIVLGPAGSTFDQALAQESAAPAATPSPVIDYRPGWPELIRTSAAAALAQAGWLAAAGACAAALVWMEPELDPALAVLAASPAQLLQQEPPLTPADLRAELAGQPLQALAEERPSPPAETLFSWQLPEASGAAVVVSLFNYADRITAALNSAASQRQRQLELIVVDDASTDGGTAVVEAWMQALLAAGDHPFVRLQLLRHSRNAGLAAARNTAFAAAQAPWCFVLDADNALYPDAVAACLALAEGGIDRLAVVHPLLAVEAEPGRPDEQRSLVSTAAWQQQRLLRENTVDAMALVRRSAWQAVGGYTHIEGGWEDYDFWCKLIAAGYHGVQCPRLLAVYRSHGGSMSQTVTNRSWRALSRTLQQRHPWLELPLAR